MFQLTRSIARAVVAGRPAAVQRCVPHVYTLSVACAPRTANCSIMPFVFTQFLLLSPFLSHDTWRKHPWQFFDPTDPFLQRRLMAARTYSTGEHHISIITCFLLLVFSCFFFLFPPLFFSLSFFSFSFLLLQISRSILLSRCRRCLQPWKKVHWWTGTWKLGAYNNVATLPFFSSLQVAPHHVSSCATFFKTSFPVYTA